MQILLNELNCNLLTGFSISQYKNELLLIGSILVIYGLELVFLKMFGKEGLYCFNVLATIAANIEVLIMVTAFGVEMTLGNVLFASTFLATDILSELYGKKAAKKAVRIGIVSSIAFIIFSQYWLLYSPNSSDFAMPSLKTIFSNTPRLMFSSMAVYAIVQTFDVWAYHKWWSFTEKKAGNKKALLWVRNNGSTIISQLLNNILFNVFAWYGVYSNKTLISIIIGSFGIFLVTSIADTPFIYITRKMMEKEIDAKKED